MNIIGLDNEAIIDEYLDCESEFPLSQNCKDTDKQSKIKMEQVFNIYLMNFRSRPPNSRQPLHQG